jgi:hypothetical protein
MPKDLRDMLRNESINKGKLSNNHRSVFEAKLQKELHSSKKGLNHFLKIAASLLVLVSLGSSIFYFSNNTVDDQPTEVAKIESLGSISPALKTIENYYLVSIQTEISNLEETPENKELLDGYLEKLGELTNDYKILTQELNNEGLNEKTINALIENLQQRLNLMHQLKEQLNSLSKLNITENENIQV